MLCFLAGLQAHDIHDAAASCASHVGLCLRLIECPAQCICHARHCTVVRQA